MDLNFIGIGSAFNPRLKNTSAYFIAGDDFFLIDCGESVFGSIWDLEELKNSKSIYVIITHLHADHVGSLASLISYNNYVLEKKIHVIHPIDTIVDYLSLSGIDKVNYIYKSNLPKAVRDVQIEAIEVKHVNDMRSFGYIITSSEKTIYYSGDAKNIPKVVLEEFLRGDIDELYQDTSVTYSENPNHLHIGKLENMIPLYKREKVYCMHLEGESEELIRAKGFNVVSF